MVAALSRTVAASRLTRPSPATTSGSGAAPAQPRLRLVPPAGAVPATPRPAPAKAPGQPPAAPPLRLTRRGRVVVAVVAALLVTALLAALSVVAGAGPAAQATNHMVSRQAVGKGLARVTVRPGESLWAVAEAADPAADTRVIVQEIIELNGLNGIVVNPGEQLLVPRG